MNIYLIRHTSVDVPRGICYGQTDVPLRPTFETEAAETRAAMASIPFDAAYTSPLSRCTLLAAYCGFPAAKRDARLLEMDFGRWEMQAFDAIEDPRLQRWYADYLHVRTTGGESFDDQYRRVAAFLDELRQGPEEHIAVFTHGGVLVAAQVYAGLATAEEAFCHIPPYGSILHICL